MRWGESMSGDGILLIEQERKGRCAPVYILDGVSLLSFSVNVIVLSTSTAIAKEFSASPWPGSPVTLSVLGRMRVMHPLNGLVTCFDIDSQAQIHNFWRSHIC